MLKKTPYSLSYQDGCQGEGIGHKSKTQEYVMKGKHGFNEKTKGYNSEMLCGKAKC